MDDEAIYAAIAAAVAKVAPRNATKLSIEAHLIDDGILDSLDMMSFLLELEERLGRKLDAVDDGFSDFRVRRLIEIIAAG